MHHMLQAFGIIAHIRVMEGFEVPSGNNWCWKLQQSMRHTHEAGY